MINWILSGLFVFWICWFTPTEWNKHYAKNAQDYSYRSACELIVDAGPDTNVCAPGGSLTLMGSITGNALFYQWTPPVGLSNPNILNPVASITGPITYTLTGYGIDPSNPNLVVNGDFEMGNTGFITDYNYVADIPGDQMEMWPEGTYTIITNPNLVHSGFSACSDHTNGSGNMMVVNGASSLQNVWCQTITTTPNSWYNISAWVASVHPTSPAMLRFSINGTPIGAIVNATSSTCQWIPFNATWNSGNTSSAEICILNLNTATSGNDFAIDDISMVNLCTVEDEIEITLYHETAPIPVIDGPVQVCAGDIGTYTATTPPTPPILSYHWTLPPGATLISGQGTSQITVLWATASDASLCLRITTRCDDHQTCYEVTVEDVPDIPPIAGAVSLCPGEMAILYTPEQDPGDEYHWILSPQVILLHGAGTNQIEIEWAVAGEAEICLEITNACGTVSNCTYLTLNPSFQTHLDTMLCQGATFVINGHTYGNGVLTGIENLTSIHGCDSTLSIQVTEVTSIEFDATQYLCPGDSVFLQGAYQTQGGIYIDSFTTAFLCDSIVITTVILTAFDTTWMISTTCVQAEAGTTVTTYNQGNCDSTVIEQILFTPPDTTLLFYTTCDPVSVGVSSQTYSNAWGCDSLVMTTTTFLLSDTTLVSLITCLPADTGTTSTLLTNINGCDSMVILTFTYGGSDTTFISGTTCTLPESGITILPLTNQHGCDSVIYTEVYLLDSDTTYLHLSSCEPQDTGVIVQLFTNISGCDSVVMTTTALLPQNLCQLEVDITVQQPLCYGDAAIVTVDISTGLGPFDLLWIHQDFTGSFSYPNPGVYTFLFDVAGSTYITLTSANGLTISDTIGVLFPPPLTIEASAVMNFNGYGVRCHGDSTGQMQIDIQSPGTPPLNYYWSSGDTVRNPVNLNAGPYQVTVTDSNGCVATSSVVLTQPDMMDYMISAENVSCYGLQNGSIVVSPVQGGVLPWVTSIDGNPFLPVLHYANLDAGMYGLQIADQNGCIFVESIALTTPAFWSIDLGPDTSLQFGISFILVPLLTGQPSGTLQFTWSDGQCENCTSRNIEALSSMILSVIATDENGCMSQDAIRIEVHLDREFFVPNIFSPNGDGINDVLLISAGQGVEEITSFVVFDRWGNLVYEAFHFAPGDPVFSWDGRFKGKIVNPGVFVYKIDIQFRDNRRISEYGNVTVIH